MEQDSGAFTGKSGKNGTALFQKFSRSAGILSASAAPAHPITHTYTSVFHFLVASGDGSGK